jgi:hypothetical protein
VIGSLDDSLLTKLTSSVTDSTVKSAIDNAFPKIQAILEQERNRLVNALMTGIPFGAASAIAATLTYYYAETVTHRALGYSLAAAIAGGGGVSVLLGLKSDQAPAAQTQGSSPSSLDPIIQNASQQLVAQADPKVRAIIEEERTRLTNALQTGLPWAIGSALAAVATAFVIPDGLEVLKILGWLITIALSAFGSWSALNTMQQKPA